VDILPISRKIESSKAIGQFEVAMGRD